MTQFGPREELCSRVRAERQAAQMSSRFVHKISYSGYLVFL
jgi:hypothetical protein